MVEKLVKEFAKIRTSLAKSKKLILSDIDKIDEKYRKLAQEEKKNLTDSLAVLNEQLKYYDKILAGESLAEETTEEPVETDATDESPKTEEEPVIEDTIFPENNEPESKEEEKEVEKPDVPVETEEAPADAWVAQDELETKKDDLNQGEPVASLVVDESGWLIPEDWE